MEKVILFYEERPDVKISMQIYFNEKGQLYFDGYDFGVLLESIYGDDDFEYTITVEPAELEKIYALYKLESNDKKGLLQKIKNDFSNIEAYTLFAKFLEENNIAFSRFTWH